VSAPKARQEGQRRRRDKKASAEGGREESDLVSLGAEGATRRSAPKAEGKKVIS
jgi:hypothetical protein